ncbi:DUF6090 family protein [Dyadobacter sp. NIV53]|uniref:DUF6090 family protein n=1 Tax=Dyadobacter sp. NIV53 TaxID=2861765 RepID=UPI001C8702F2|nr:DUF6090 family protein [Dyadobacter sp. NIV53]
MESERSENLKKYAFEFLTIFIGIFAAFALDNWKENRKDQQTEIKILTEISNGLVKDLDDININEMGHKQGLEATKFFRNLITTPQIKTSSPAFLYFNLFRDFVSVQNTSGYETLKSKGLEIIENDSLRSNIISLYEYDYNALRKLEENYSEIQFQESYFNEFNRSLAPNFTFDKKGDINGINSPIKIPENEKKILMVDLWKIEKNRRFMLQYYSVVKVKIKKLQEEIIRELKK